MKTINQVRFAVGVMSVAAFLAMSVSAQAATKTGELGIGVGSSDNIFKAPDDEVRDTIYMVAADFSVFSDTGRVQTDTFAQLAYMDYKEASYDSEVVGGFLSLNKLHLVPDRFAWVINDNFGQLVTNPLSPARPNNRENVNIFSTGPVVNFFANPRNVGKIELLYSSVGYEESPDDNERLLGALTLGREIRRGHTLSIVGRTETIDFDQSSAATDFDRSEAYLSYQIAGNTNTLNVDAGYTQVDIAAESLSGLLFRLNWHKEFSAGSNLSVYGGTRYSDEGNLFRLYQDELRDLGDTADLVNSSEPFTNNYVLGIYTHSSGRNVFRLAAAFNQADFKGSSGEDRDTYRVNIDLRRDFSQSIFGRVGLTYVKRELKYLDRRTNTSAATLVLGYRFGPRVSSSLLYRYSERNDSDPLESFDESRVFLTFSYAPRWAQ